MSLKELIETNRKKLYRSFMTGSILFLENFDDDEPTTHAYDYVFGLAKKLEKRKCKKNTIKNIFFHIEQINYDEIIIAL
jgi:hypothetical protein